MQGLAGLLGKAFTRQDGDALAQVLVRCARLAGETSQHKALLLQEGVLAGVAELALLHSESGDTSLARAVAKCLAALSLGGTAAEGEALVGAAPALVGWVQRGGKVRGHSLAAIVNMSEICWLRPRLGNDGVIGSLVAEYSRVEGKMLACVVTALCLYCRESVNRVKLREGGGCRLLVEVLVSRQPAIVDLHDRVINSLLQFIYDNHSLNVLMDCGLVFALVALLEEHIEQVRDGREGQACLCAGETGEEEENTEVPEKSDAGVADDGFEGAADQLQSIKVGERFLGTRQKKDAVENNATNSSVQDIGDEKFPSVAQSRQTPVEVDKAGTPRSSRPDQVFRLTSPSYQAVHWELEQFRQLREARAGGGALISSGCSPCSSPEWAPTSPSSLCLSPDRSPPPLSCHYSPAHSTSSSQSHSYSPTYSSYSPSSSPSYSPQEPSYSPVENFSDEEESETPVEEAHPPPEAGPSSRLEPCKRPPPQSPSSPPASKRSNPTYLGLPFPIPCSSASPPPRPLPRPPRYNRSSSSLLSSPPLQRHPRTLDLTPRPTPSQGSRLSWILQLLSRLTQADRPHADLTSERTVAAVFTFISQVPDGVLKAGKILTRLSTNLHCLLPFILHRHLPFFLLFLARDRLSSLSSCPSCISHLREVQKLVSQLSNNLSLLAETGYGEGEVCHRLVAPNTPPEEKLNISICAPLLLRQRKLLRNVLVTHDSLDYLLDFLETAKPKEDQEEEDDEDAQCLFTQAVVSLSHLAKHLGIQAPQPLLEGGQEECSSAEWNHDHDITLVLDSGESVEASRSVLTNASPVFAAMLAGGFSESGFTEVPLPLTSLPALNCLLHHLYGCPAPCLQFRQLPIPTLLELVSLSDKFLLADLNLAITSCIVRRCLGAGADLPLVYRLALQRDYPVPGSTLAQATVCLSLVCDVDCWQRASMVRSIVTSDMKGDYIDDVGKLLRAKLFEKP